jgi:ribose transport system ATP-binding protein
MAGVSKRYGGVRALERCDFACRSGSIHAVLGENGAGKSTLIKIASGVVQPDEGTLALDGHTVTFPTPASANAQGVVCIFQELSLMPDLTVADNIAIADPPRWLKLGRFGLIDGKAQRRRAEAVLARIGCEDVDPRSLVRDLPLSRRQMVEIAKALSIDARLIIMDEPTSSLTLTETERLLQVIKDLRAAGVSIIYISHRLAEVRDCADRVVVLRDGKRVGELGPGEASHAAMIRLMIGRDLKSIYVPPAAPPQDKGLEIAELVTSAFSECKVSLTVHRGEILGLAGLIGSGRTSLAQSLFGISPPIGGAIRLDGKPITVSTARDAIDNGIYLIPEDRKKAGLVLDLPIFENISLADLGTYANMSLVDGDAERKAAEIQAKSLSIKAPSVLTRAVTLSGGNQQKVVLGKWLSMRPQVIIFDEPTRGIDVGAKSEIYNLMRGLADSGVAILMISSDMEEVIGVSDRIAVMHEGQISGFLERSEFSEHNVLLLAVGGEGKEGASHDA